MSADPLDVHLGGTGIEGFVHHFSQGAAVDGVGKIHREPADVQGFGPFQPHFLVRNEGHVNGPVVDFRMVRKILEHGHYIGHRGLVVRPQDAGAIGEHDVLSHIIRQLRGFGGLHEDAFFSVEDQVSPWVVPDHLGMDLRAQVHIHRIQMAAEADFGHRTGEPLRQVGRQVSGKDAPVAEMQVLQIHDFQFRFQLPGHMPLVLGAGDGGNSGPALGRDVHIPEKTVKQLLGQLRHGQFLLGCFGDIIA